MIVMRGFIKGVFLSSLFWEQYFLKLDVRQQKHKDCQQESSCYRDMSTLPDEVAQSLFFLDSNLGEEKTSDGVHPTPYLVLLLKEFDEHLRQHFGVTLV